MPINANKPENWKKDINQSVDFYNQWFVHFAPKAYRSARIDTAKQVEQALVQTKYLTHLEPEILQNNPAVLPILRMSTSPPIARDRLIGLSDVSSNLVKSMELDSRIPPHMKASEIRKQLIKIGTVIRQLADVDIFTWLESKKVPNKDDAYRAATIVADRLTGAVADPIIRNAQEKRQLDSIKKWLETRGYTYAKPLEGVKASEMAPGSFSFRFNVPVNQQGRSAHVNIPIDAIIMPRRRNDGQLPVMIEAKSAGDYTNTNKRRKEEATKVNQLRSTYGDGVRFILFLCGYFNSGYLGYEAAEGIDWVWEHRIDDLAQAGL